MGMTMKSVMLNLFQHLNAINEKRDPEPSSGRQNGTHGVVSKVEEINFFTIPG
jgi:hypothetical protein